MGSPGIPFSQLHKGAEREGVNIKPDKNKKEKKEREREGGKKIGPVVALGVNLKQRFKRVCVVFTSE